jgi:AmmeMemoRadiSam system protein A
MKLTTEDKKALLGLARKTIELYINEHKIYDPPKGIKEKFSQKAGAFTTIREQGNLRGCIGFIIAYKPLWETIRDTAIESSTRDPRFPSVSSNEINKITIEISVLTPPELVKSADDIVLGRDGVIVKKGWNQGVFLPQVATETGWDKETFLNELCYGKAGLPPDAWKQKDVELRTFQAIVFSEEDLK